MTFRPSGDNSSTSEEISLVGGVNWNCSFFRNHHISFPPKPLV